MKNITQKLQKPAASLFWYGAATLFPNLVQVKNLLQNLGLENLPIEPFLLAAKTRAMEFHGNVKPEEVDQNASRMEYA